MKVLSPLLLAVGASAFAPSTQMLRTSTSLSMAIAPENEVGVLPPVGFFDPLDLVNNGPYGSPRENFEHYRGVEVKHGRIAMAATLGMITQELYRFDGYISPSQNLKFVEIPNGLEALRVTPIEGLVQMAVLIGAHELIVKQVEGKAPGNFGTGYWGITLDDQSAKQLRALNVEVQNGRLAMLGILGMFASEIVHKGEVLADFKFLG
eukprot:CAMPEP_0195518938 /NCGR_PEP_ID=MMETSP0794_2-20130614/13998_1 /TAXON_ID=515487 /ORGANISM="Stephanopyxis turris, Strain CCMP 815" /LENGTH=206 /DNA_ID=CAMNT_0040647993 /DNA_START=38 /DNA_END=658 /DNA_ORIENTATION=+